MTGKIYSECEIFYNAPISPGIFELMFKSPEIAASARPGQFVMVYMKNPATLLPRPISICETSPDGAVRLVYRVSGTGTREMSGYKPGDIVKIMGPLGNGYPIPTGIKNAALVGGGIGVPPLLSLASGFRKNHPDAKLTAVLGFKSEPILVGVFQKNGVDTRVAIEDKGEGNAVEMLQIINDKFDIFYGCGPKPMLSSLAAYAEKIKTPCYISLEERMGCGFGVCVGCACKIKNADSTETYKKVCTDGPVFNANDVIFE